ncbi:MAG: acetyl-CoA C-acyltransferase, partial [Leifsonia sp.]
MPGDAVIVAARRTPIGTRGRGLATLTVDQLAAPVLRANLQDGMAALPEGSLGDGSLGDVVLGNCMGPGGNPARVS